ncbi:MAG: class I SAM-dependent RNA methyltransferase [Acetobacteraceae bacterium]|nr:class I SAM-dependent RNA methyltransferase [Acetobacteraceae bacterium]
MLTPSRPSSRYNPNSARPAPPESVTAHITHIGADGDGIGVHADGSTLYVPLTVPGDIVRVRPLARRGEGWAAEIEDIEHPGPGRREPACGHFGVCGGCTSQHWDDAAYLAWKTSRLTEALRRAGYDNPPMALIVSGVAGTRRRMDLALRRIQGGMVAGLHRARGGEVVDIEECPVLHATLFRLIAPFRALSTSLSAIRREASLAANLLDSGPDLLLRTDGELTLPDRTKLIAFAHTHRLPRISWAFGNRPTEAVCILNPPVMTFSGATVVPPPGAFLQATVEGEAAIVAAVLDGLPTKRTARARVLELYSGCGTISFALAERIRVLAIEGDAELVTSCHNAINQAGLMGKVEINRRDLARQPFLAKELAAFTAVVLDPPHAGAAAQMPHIAQAKVPTVIYVSCDPVSLGRDATELHRAGYRLEKVTPIDQFLWSARLEAVAVFRLGR